MSASWYDVLGVETDATTDQIREAWQEAIVGLGPTHKRFALYNEAAAVLLDDALRAEYDASLSPDLAADEAADESESDVPEGHDESSDDSGDGAGEDSGHGAGDDSGDGAGEDEVPEPAPKKSVPPKTQPAKTGSSKAGWSTSVPQKSGPQKAPQKAPQKSGPQKSASAKSGSQATPEDTKRPRTGGGLPLVPTWLILGLALATIVVAGVAFFWHRGQEDTRREADAVAEAVTAARNAAPKILSYSADTAEQDRAAALKVLTGDLKCEYDTLWEERLSKLLKGSQAFAKTTVAAAAVSDVKNDGERVQVLLVLDTDSGSARTQNQMVTLSFTATMVEKDGDWLVEKFDGWDPEAVAASPSGKGSAGPSASAGSEPSAEPKSGACS